MPLLDHFHAPLKDARHWESFYTRWASEMADALNEILPKDNYFADTQVHIGACVKIDFAASENQGFVAPSGSIPTVFPDIIEVQIINTREGPTLVAAVEFVSPGIKNRAAARQAFAAKCCLHLQRGIGLVVIDVVTIHTGNMHNELMDLMGVSSDLSLPPETSLYATAYHPIRREGKEEIDWWVQHLAVGEELPIMPLAVRGLGFLPLDLATTYAEARRTRRI